MLGRSIPIEQLSAVAQSALRFRTIPKRASGNAKARRYKQFLRSAEWRDQRARVLERDGWTCQNCGVNEPENMTVHHKRYSAVIEDTPDSDLVAACMDCNVGEREARVAGFLKEQRGGKMA